jgi:hypothetical protein
MLIQVLTHQPEGQLQEQHKHMLRDNIHHVHYTCVGHRKENFKDMMKMEVQTQADKDKDYDIKFILQEKYKKEMQQ